MASNKKFKILKGAVATATVAAIVAPVGGVGATTVESENQAHSQTSNQIDGQANEQVEIQINDEADVQLNEQIEVQIDEQTDVQVNEQAEVQTDGQADNQTNNQEDVQINDVQIRDVSRGNVGDTNTNIIRTNSNKPEVPYFYYWTNGNNVYLSWDYGHIANRPTKIEVVVDKDINFSNPSYVEVKPKGAEFVSDASGSFYLRTRFFDSSGNVTHESIRKVIKNSTETREIKGLRYTPSGTGIKIEWNNFTSGLKSGQYFLNGQQPYNLSSSDIKNNSVFIDNVSEGSEIRLKFINGAGLEYNGVVFVKKGSLQPTSNISLGVSQDGVGLGVDLSKTNFKQGNKFSVQVTQKDSKDLIVKGTQVTLEKDKGSFIVYPDNGKTFLNTDYVVTITDLSTGDVFTYNYSHALYSIPSFVSVGLSDGQVVSSWSKIDGVDRTELTWSTSSDFSNNKVEKIGAGKNGITFKTNATGGQTIYLLLTTYDKQGRVITQDVSSVVVGNAEGKLSNFKGVYKSNDTVEFSWNKLNTSIEKGILKVNDRIVVLSPSELATLNSTNTLTVGGFTKGNKYDVSLYLVDGSGKVHKGNVTSIQTQGSTEGTSDVLIDGVSGIIGRYTQNPGILSLLLDESQYDVSPNSSIGILINGQNISSVSASYVKESNAINITGLIPTKPYRNISLSYTSKSGEKKTINIPNLTIKVGSSLDSFLVNAYNKSVSRDTQSIDEDGYNYWKNGLLSKNITLSYFIRNLAFVPEFMNLVNSPQDLVSRLYNVLVLRNPEPQGLQFWTSVYNELVSNGVSHKEATIKILTDMTTSSEFSNLAERLGVNP